MNKPIQFDPSRGLVMAFAIALLATGCTTIPQAELQAYHQAFDAVRLQSENVLADYSAARQAKSNLMLRAASLKATAAGGAGLDVRLNLRRFDARTAGAISENEIEVRLRAWQVAASYNDALLALANGKSSEIATGATGLLTSLKAFPIKEVSAAALEAVPYASAIVPILELVQKEVEARHFRQAILGAAPLLAKFVEALYQDANLFREYRVTWLNYRFGFEEESRLVEAAAEFQRTMNARVWAATSTVQELLDQINSTRILAGGGASFPELKLAPTAGAAAAANEAAELAALRILVTQAQDYAKAARATALELENYQKVMDSYALLLQAFEQSFKQLKDAAEKNVHKIPDAGQLETILSSVRMAYTTYTQTK